MNETNIFLRNGYIPLPESTSNLNTPESLGSILMNLEYYGFALSRDAFEKIQSLSTENLGKWWSEIEPELKKITGDDRNIGDFVVYKNFPAEVLDKSEAEYWIPQILMYWGFPNELFTEEVKPREDMNPKDRKSTTLQPVTNQTLQVIFKSLLKSNVRWKDLEFQDVLFLAGKFPVDFTLIKFKENLVKLASALIANSIPVKVSTATDVLRLAAGLSDGDVSLREKVKFKSFNRRTRKYLISMLEGCRNLDEDVARRAEVWKRFLHNLHPGDYKETCPRVCQAADALYKDTFETFNARVEQMIANIDTDVLSLLATRPGEFSRRLVHMLDVFGTIAANTFVEVLPKLSLHQLLSLKKHLVVANHRETRIFPPKGNWAKAQIGSPRPIKDQYVLTRLIEEISLEVSGRVPLVKSVSTDTEDVKLPSNGSMDGGVYTRGTVFQIPEGVKFIRTASYWACKRESRYNNWFDNGWNFFDENWKSVGVCCWNHPKFGNAAIFSGDPTNSKEMQGRAAQLIDLYPARLLDRGIRYAVWNVLCYSHIKFSQAEDVFAALQWGSEPQKGKLFEPSRCQLSFQLTDDCYTKCVCAIDLWQGSMIYLDANLKSHVNSAASNGNILSKTMPAYMDYLKSLPSVYDLFSGSVDAIKGKGHVLYSDKDIKLSADDLAYVFQPQGLNDFQRIDVNEVLNK